MRRRPPQGPLQVEHCRPSCSRGMALALQSRRQLRETQRPAHLRQGLQLMGWSHEGSGSWGGARADLM